MSVPLGLDITHAEVVARLFPAVGRTGLPLDGMIPGRYWKAGEFPKLDATELDEAVAALLVKKGSPRFLGLNEFAERGLSCPFYAWRSHVAIAASHAKKNVYGLSDQRKVALQNELAAWRRRISQAKIVLRSPLDLPVPVGSLHITPGDLGMFGEDGGYYVYNQRKQRFLSIKKEIEQDEEMCVQIACEIQRIEQITEGKSGRNLPNPWLTPFFVWMANLWSISTGGTVPFDSEPFGNLLRAAMNVVSASKAPLFSWGQAKSLHKRFKDSKSGEGFRMGESDTLSLERLDGIEQRGDETRHLIDLEHRAIECSRFVSTLAYGALYLRDHNEGCLALIIREVVLKHEMEIESIYSPRVALQLGWLETPDREAVRKNIREAVQMAKDGNVAAIIILEIARVYDDARDIIQTTGWKSISSISKDKDLLLVAGELNKESGAWNKQTGEQKALAVAAPLIQTGILRRHCPQASQD